MSTFPFEFEFEFVPFEVWRRTAAGCGVTPVQTRDYRWVKPAGPEDGNAADGPRSTVVDRVDAAALSPAAFARRFMGQNRPVVLRGATRGWRAEREWVGADGGLDTAHWRAEFGSASVCVARCWEREFSDQPRQDMTVAEWLDVWSSQPPLYLKDWHQVRDFPGYGAYQVPPHVADDWLNEYWDSCQPGGSVFRLQQHLPAATGPPGPLALHDPTPTTSGLDLRPPEEAGPAAAALLAGNDYRFVYAGPAGSWTPLHRDVFCSYSWSANVLGRKLWYMFPPDTEGMLVRPDLDGRCVYDVRSPDLAVFPRFPQAWARCVRVVQEPGDMMFVPAGWYHQVHNLEATVSINHNWFNAFSVDMVGAFVLAELETTRRVLAEFAGGTAPRSDESDDDDEDACQRVLKANAGIDLLEWFVLLVDAASKQETRLALASSASSASPDGVDASVAWLGLLRAHALLRSLWARPWVRKAARSRLDRDQLRVLLARICAARSQWLLPWDHVASFLSVSDRECLLRATQWRTKTTLQSRRQQQPSL